MESIEECIMDFKQKVQQIKRDKLIDRFQEMITRISDIIDEVVAHRMAQKISVDANQFKIVDKYYDFLKGTMKLSVEIDVVTENKVDDEDEQWTEDNYDELVKIHDEIKELLNVILTIKPA